MVLGDIRSDYPKVYTYTEFERLMIPSYQFLIFVHFGNMNIESMLGLECFLAMVTIVAEMTRKVNAFNVISKMTDMLVFFSTDVAFVASSPILKLGLLHVLVKHHSWGVMS